VTTGAHSIGWRAGIIAAGRGERLRVHGGPLKPLVSVSGQTLVERVLWSLAEVAPAETVIIVNEESVSVRDVVSATRWPFPVRWIIETTPSSMHSFLRIVEALSAGDHPGPFLVSTVDTVAPTGAFAAFAVAASESGADLSLAVHTPVADDEKPLLVRMADRGSRVEALGPTVTSGAGRVYATAGYYAVRPSILAEAAVARADGLSALREFLGRLLARGYQIDAIPVAPGVDVDHPADIGAAESFLRQARVS
jgi:NDP-sugar pyrophosphorylase family protein